MEPIFAMEEFSEDDIKYIYFKCKGEPQKLSVVISKLLDKQGVILSDNNKKAKINKKILLNILEKEYIRYNPNDFTPIQKWIIFSFLCLYEGVSIQIIKDLALYISEKNALFYAYSNKNFFEELVKLVDHNQLRSDGSCLMFCHDSDYIDFMDIFNTSNMVQIFSENTYEFLKNNKQLSDREDLICQHMRKANISGWQEKNYLYGETLYSKHLYFDAQKVFLHLLEKPELLSMKQLLIIALNQYQTGDYGSTIKIIEKININSLSDKSNKFNLYYYWGKSIYNYNGNISKAVEKLMEAVKCVDEDSREYVSIQNLLQMYYLEIPGKFQIASEIFDKICSKYKDL